MKFNTENLGATIWHYLTKSIAGLLMLALVWQGVILGVDAATLPSPLLATSADSISKQVTGKAEEMKGSATKAIGKAQSAMEDKGGAAKMKVKDDLTETKIAVDRTKARAENAADKATEKVKNFFGK
jgi:uncharacterized protein YjbJ (UPF0337 family)